MGGINQVPNFTIYTKSHEFLPSGHSENRYNIQKYWNNLSPIIPIKAEYIIKETTITGLVNNDNFDEEIELRKLREQNQLIRNANLVKQVKSVNEYRCQICNEIIKLRDDNIYAEVHHIKPLGQPHNGPDIIQNMLCVCPNCHVKLDYGSILIDYSIASASKHEINVEFIDYHNEVICIS